MARWYRIAALALLLLLAGSRLTFADERVPFQRGVASDDLWAFVKAYLLERDPRIVDVYLEEWGTSEAEKWEKVRNYGLEVGYYDLNDDGVPEMFLFLEISGHCGSAGCETIVFEWKDGGWRRLTGIFAYSLMGDNLPREQHGPFIVVTDERFGGYRTFHNDEYAVEWDDGSYGGLYCLSRRCEEERNDEIDMRSKYRADNAEFLKEYFYNVYAKGHRFRSGELRLENLKVGHYDLNADGTPELIVSVAERRRGNFIHGETLVFERREGRWAPIGEFFVDAILWVGDDKVLGYKTLRDRDRAIRWDGTRYR
jgi:hypothetical protein